MFDGRIKARIVRGAPSGVKSTSTQNIIENSKRLREQRADERLKSSSALFIQKFYRGWIQRKKVVETLMTEYRVKIDGIQKIKTLFGMKGQSFVIPIETLKRLLRMKLLFGVLKPTTEQYDKNLHEYLNESLTTSVIENNLGSCITTESTQSSATYLIIIFLRIILSAVNLSNEDTYLSSTITTLELLFFRNSSVDNSNTICLHLLRILEVSFDCICEAAHKLLKRDKILQMVTNNKSISILSNRLSDLLLTLIQILITRQIEHRYEYSEYIQNYKIRQPWVYLVKNILSNTSEYHYDRIQSLHMTLYINKSHGWCIVFTVILQELMTASNNHHLSLVSCIRVLTIYHKMYTETKSSLSQKEEKSSSCILSLHQNQEESKKEIEDDVKRIKIEPSSFTTIKSTSLSSSSSLIRMGVSEDYSPKIIDSNTFSQTPPLPPSSPSSSFPSLSLIESKVMEYIIAQVPWSSILTITEHTDIYEMWLRNIAATAGSSGINSSSSSSMSSTKMMALVNIIYEKHIPHSISSSSSSSSSSNTTTIMIPSTDSTSSSSSSSSSSSLTIPSGVKGLEVEIYHLIKKLHESEHTPHLSSFLPNLDCISDWIYILLQQSTIFTDLSIRRGHDMKKKDEWGLLLQSITDIYLSIFIYTNPHLTSVLSPTSETSLTSSSNVPSLLSKQYRNKSLSQYVLDKLAFSKVYIDLVRTIWIYLKSSLKSKEIVLELLILYDQYLLQSIQYHSSRRFSTSNTANTTTTTTTATTIPTSYSLSTFLSTITLSTTLQVIVNNTSQSTDQFILQHVSLFYLLIYVVTHKLTILDDEEFFEYQTVLPIDDFIDIVYILKQLLYRIYCTSLPIITTTITSSTTSITTNTASYNATSQTPTAVSLFSSVGLKSTATTTATTPFTLSLSSDNVSYEIDKVMIKRAQYQYICTKLFNALFARHERRPFIRTQDWEWDNIQVLAGDLSDRKLSDLASRQSSSTTHTTSLSDHNDADDSNTGIGDKAINMKLFLSNDVYQKALTCIPQVIPFTQRLKIFHSLVIMDYTKYQPTNAFFRPSTTTRIQIRRNHLVEDSYEYLGHLSTDKLKSRIQIEFISADGLPEAGIDGGGLFKAFLDEFMKQAYDPVTGLFILNSDQLLLPNPASHIAVENHLEYFHFLGKMLGVCLFHRTLVEPQFAGVFLNLLLGKKNALDDIWVVDRSIHHSLMALKHMVYHPHHSHLSSHQQQEKQSETQTQTQIQQTLSDSSSPSNSMINTNTNMSSMKNSSSSISSSSEDTTIIDMITESELISDTSPLTSTINTSENTVVDTQQKKGEESKMGIETDPIAALGLYFEINTSKYDMDVTEELIPNGSQILVTKHNIHLYIHKYANYKLNLETSAQTKAFLSGFRKLIPLEWIKLFHAREIQQLISGEQKCINIEDMRRHVNYNGGYYDDHPYIQGFWKIVSEMTPAQQGNLLKFVTSCSRQPLLGFSQLNPKFGILKVAPYNYDEYEEITTALAPRLPSAATCMNLLKLPEYDTIDMLREKLLYAITSDSGFELS